MKIARYASLQKLKRDRAKIKGIPEDESVEDIDLTDRDKYRKSEAPAEDKAQFMAMMAANIQITKVREVKEFIREKFTGGGAESSALRKLKKDEESQ